MCSFICGSHTDLNHLFITSPQIRRDLFLFTEIVLSLYLVSETITLFSEQRRYSVTAPAGTLCPWAASIFTGCRGNFSHFNTRYPAPGFANMCQCRRKYDLHPVTFVPEPPENTFLLSVSPCEILTVNGQ